MITFADVYNYNIPDQYDTDVRYNSCSSTIIVHAVIILIKIST